LATLAVPGFAALRRSTGLSSAANELLGAIHLARSAAGRRGVPAVVCLTADARTCVSQPGGPAIGWLVFHTEGAGAVAQPTSPGAVFHTFHLSPDISISGTRPALTFWPVARAGSTGTFELCDVERRAPGKVIVVSQTGRPRVAAESASCGR
jgi:type IV fimbrial biogenesis protein FimT